MSHNFSTEYDLTREVIRKGSFPKDTAVEELLKHLKQLLGSDGFDDAKSGALDELRKHLADFNFASLFTGKNTDEAGNLLATAGAYKDKTFKGGEATAQRVAALKLLRHTHFVSKTGAKSLWVISVPKTYTDWPSFEFKPHAGSEAKLKDKASRVREYFTASQRKDMHKGAQLALAWVQKTLVVLANYGKDKGASAALVERWFKTGDTTAANLTTIVSSLTAGFKKIQAVLNGNRLIFTDNPPDRGSEDEKYTEAFVWNGAWKDRLKVVYIEKGFFARGGNVLSGKENWARIIIHELTHSELGTDDYPPDNSYGWQGINPADPKFNGNKAIINAENWAYFAADCAAALSTGERSTALKLP